MENSEYKTAVTDVLNSHVTVRHFTDEPIPSGMVDAIIEAARRSPTSSNRQTYSIIVVRNPEVKAQLAVLAGGQKHVEVCPVFLAFCADNTRVLATGDMHGVEILQSFETTLVATVDAALAGMSANTAAESFGLGTVMIGAMRNHPKEAAELLGMPKGTYIVYGMCLGWPKHEKSAELKPRFEKDVIVYEERYEVDRDITADIAQYNQQLADFYESRGHNLDKDAWSAPIANQLQNPRRPDLRKTLEEMGFSFK